MLALGLALTIGTGLFVASEFSLINLERNDLEARRERGERGLSNTIKALKRTSTHLSGAQLGITLTTMLTGFLAEPALTKLLEPSFAAFALDAGAKHTLAVALGMLIATIFSTLIGELVPKKLALTLPLEVNKAVVLFQLAFTWLTGWMLFALNGTGNAIVRLMGIEPKEELSSSRTAEELISLVRRSASLGALDAQTATLLTKTLALSQLVAADVMTPRPRMHSVDASASATDVIALCNKTGHSRFPVTDGSSDDVIGVVHVKQAASVPREKRADVPATALMVEPLRVPETMRLETLMVELRAKGLQLAIVIDEYGGTAGIITMEDLVEELIGDIRDEYDTDASEGVIPPGKDVVVDGLLNLDDFQEETLMELPEGPYDTAAGFMAAQLGRIPMVGDEIVIDAGSLSVLEMDGRRVSRIRVVRSATIGE